MKNLIEIAEVVNKKRVSKIEIFNAHNLENRQSKFNEFYLALQDNKFRNDLEAAALLYDCDPGDPRYRQLKSRFRRRLLNSLFFLDVNAPLAGNYEQAYYHCQREWAQVRILQSYNARAAAAYLARQMLTTALKFRFSELVIECARLLREQAADKGDLNDFDTYQAHLDEFAPIRAAEIHSEELHLRTLLLYQQEDPRADEPFPHLDEYGNELLRLSENHPSPLISLNTFFVWIMNFELRRDFGGVLEVYEQANQYLEGHPEYFQAGPAARLYTKQMSALLHLDRYKDGQIAAERNLHRIPEEDPHWFRFMEFYLLLSLHTNNLVSSAAILNRVTSHKQYRKLDTTMSEKWLLYEGYLHYIFSMETARTPRLTKPKREPVRVSKLLERPLNRDRDRRPFTFHVLLLRLLQALNRGRKSAIAEQITQLHTFTVSYLRKEPYFRQNQFARLLHQLAKAELQPDQLSNTRKYEERLRERPFFYRGRLSELEVLPFERLWKLICEQVK